MDPLSITTGILALLGACVSTGVALREFYDGIATANIRVKGLLTDVESFTQVLCLMKDTLEKESIQSSLQSTGHIGNHWDNVSTSIRDGQVTLRQLQETIEKANKSVSLLDGPRRHLRLKGAAEEIAVYQQQIRSCRDTLQLSLQTIILWNQVTVRESTDKILPTLDEIQQSIRRIAFELNDRISSLQGTIESRSSDHELHSLNNLRNCVKSAASVVSSASTTLGVENPARVSTYGSEYGDCFPPEPSETMLRWISSNTVHEFEEGKDTESSISGPKPASGKSLELTRESSESDISDSDGELEAEIIQSLLRRGKDKLASQELEDAERYFRNCLTRASSNGSSVSLHRLVGPTSEIMTLLITTYRQQEKWDEAHSLLLDKIALESRGSSKASQGVLVDMLILVDVLFKKSAYAEALLHGRRALKSYRKLGSDGTLGVQDSLRLLCQVCKAAGYHDEEDAYSTHLAYILQQPTQIPNHTPVPKDHRSEPVTLPTGSTFRNDRLMKEASAENLGKLNDLNPTNSRPSVDQLTPSSATRTDQGRFSLSSFGSHEPASPNTTYTSLSAVSKENLSAIEESSRSDATKSYVSDMTSLSDSIKSPVSKSAPVPDPTYTNVPRSAPIFNPTFANTPWSTAVFDHSHTYKPEPTPISDPPHTYVSKLRAIPDPTYTHVSESTPVSDPSNTHPLESTPVLHPTYIHLPESPPGSDDTKSSVLQSSPLSHLGGTLEQVKVKNDSLLLPIAQPVNAIKSTLEISKTDDSDNSQADMATVSIPAVPVLLNTLERQKQKAPQFASSHHNYKKIEEVAIKYFRENRGNPPKPTSPTQSASNEPIKISDYELPQWIGTLQQDWVPNELSQVSLDSFEKPVQKSKSAINLCDLNSIQSAAGLIQKSKSTANLHGNSVTAAGGDALAFVKSTSAINEEDDWDAIYRHPRKLSLPYTNKSVSSKITSTANGKDDWESIFAPLDKFLPLGYNVKPITPIEDLPDSQSASNAMPSQPELEVSSVKVETNDNDILDDSNKHHDHVLRALVEMGYSQSKALDALKKYDYDLERAADQLVTESSEEQNPIGSQTKHTRSESGSSTSKEKHMGVQDFRFFVTPVLETGDNSGASITNHEMKSSLDPAPRPISFHTLVQLQSKKPSVSSFIDRPSPTGLTTRRSEPDMAEQARSHKRGFSLQDENLRPRNPLAVRFDAEPQSPSEVLGDRPSVANDLSPHLTRLFSSKTEEVGSSSQRAVNWENSTNTPAITFNEMLSERDTIRRKIVIVGDPYCGKSSLCSVFSKNIVPQTYRPTDVDTNIGHVEVNAKRVELILWDTGGDYNRSSIRLQCYRDSHVVLICFSIDNLDSLDNAEELFLKELQSAYNCSARYILVGLKSDLRNDLNTIHRLQAVNQSPVRMDEARAVAFRIGANRYIECSAMTGEFVKEVFEDAARLALMPNDKIKKMRSLRRIFGKD